MKETSRRAFLATVGKGAVAASVGAEWANVLAAGETERAAETARLSFGDLDGLVNLMQDTPASRIVGVAVDRLKSGTDLRQLVAAAALANARRFGGEDYVGFHTIMALGPAWHMAQELPVERQALPVLKVLHRNTSRLQESGPGDVLRPLDPMPNATEPGNDAIRDAVRARDGARADSLLNTFSQNPAKSLNAVLTAVADDAEVHRVALPYRSWDLLSIIGMERANVLLRQSVHYCLRAEGYAGGDRNGLRALLPKLMDEHNLHDREAGTRTMDDAWVDAFSRTLFESTAEQAAGAAAAALSDGIAPDAVGEAISLAANQLVLRDHGRSLAEEQVGKAVGSVHGDSIGVHASDSANAWRNLARVADSRQRFTCLVLGAWQVARDRVGRGGDFLHWEALPYESHRKSISGDSQPALLGQLEESIRGSLQARAAAIVHRCGQSGADPEPVFQTLLKYAVSEDGSLHAEKYYRTVREEFDSTRAAFRWRHLIGLARVTASEFGRPAPGIAEARSLLGLT